MLHRRIAGVFEISRESNGSDAQHFAVREAVTRHLEFGNRFHRTMQALDRAVNRRGRHYVPFLFVTTTDWWLGFSFPTVVLLNDQLLPGTVERTVLHEIGHLLASYLQVWPYSGHAAETACDEFRDWVLDGTPDGSVWDKLSAVLPPV